MFLFQLHADPRHLPSFPTRRSSDLGHDCGNRITHMPHVIDAKGLLVLADRQDAVLNREVLSDSVRDRKSTRLNSSHMSISYAVFCLKKKNTTSAFIQMLCDITPSFV